MDYLSATGQIAGAALRAQSLRMRVIAENMANANATGRSPGADPYQRKTVTFESSLDDATQVESVRIGEIGHSTAPFRIERIPGHPAADASGNVKLPNVDMLVEVGDMNEANRSYGANLKMIKVANDLVSMTLDLLRT